MKSKTLIPFGERIKEIREGRNYTQEFVASELGVSQRAYSKLETGETMVKGDVLVELAKIFKVDIIDLIPQDAVLTYNNYKTHNGDAIVYRKETSDKVEEVYKKLIDSKDKQIESLNNTIRANENLISFLKKQIENK